MATGSFPRFSAHFPKETSGVYRVVWTSVHYKTSNMKKVCYVKSSSSVQSHFGQNVELAVRCQQPAGSWVSIYPGGCPVSSLCITPIISTIKQLQDTSRKKIKLRKYFLLQRGCDLRHMSLSTSWVRNNNHYLVQPRSFQHTGNVYGKQKSTDQKWLFSTAFCHSHLF